MPELYFACSKLKQALNVVPIRARLSLSVEKFAGTELQNSYNCLCAALAWPIKKSARLSIQNLRPIKAEYAQEDPWDLLMAWGKTCLCN